MMNGNKLENLESNESNRIESICSIEEPGRCGGGRFRARGRVLAISFIKSASPKKTTSTDLKRPRLLGRFRSFEVNDLGRPGHNFNFDKTLRNDFDFFCQSQHEVSTEGVDTHGKKDQIETIFRRVAWKPFLIVGGLISLIYSICNYG